MLPPLYFDIYTVVIITVRAMNTEESSPGGEESADDTITGAGGEGHDGEESVDETITGDGGEGHGGAGLWR